MRDSAPERTDVQALPLHNVYARQAQKTLYLDGLRGLAAFLVYMQHQTGYFYGHEADYDLGFGAKAADGRINRQFASLPGIRLLFAGGSAAVAIFFVLSGYVLSRRSFYMISNGQHQECSSGLKSAIARRPFRLYLPVIGITVMFVFWLHLPFGFDPKVNVPTKQTSLLAELLNCFKQLAIYLNPFQQHGWFIAWFPYNGTLWTIPIELKGSMLVFGVLVFLNSAAGGVIQRHQSAVLLTVAYGLLMFDQWTMSLFVYGMLLAARDVNISLEKSSSTKAGSGKYPRLRALSRHCVLLAALYLLSQPAKGKEVNFSSETPGWASLTKLIPPSYLKDEYYRFYHAIGAVMLVHSVLRMSWLQQLLSTRVLLYLGRVSYSFYLIHIPVMWIYGDRAQRLLGVHGRNWNGPLWVDAKIAHLVPDIGPVGLSTRFIVVIWSVLPVVLGLSEISTRFLDGPSIDFSRWLARKMRLENGPVTAHTVKDPRRKNGAKVDPVSDRLD